MDSSDLFWINLDRHILGLVVVVQSLNCVQFFATPWTVTYQASLSFTIFWSLLKLMSTESVMPSNHLILCCPLFLLPSARAGTWTNGCYGSPYTVRLLLNSTGWWYSITGQLVCSGEKQAMAGGRLCCGGSPLTPIRKESAALGSGQHLHSVCS